MSTDAVRPQTPWALRLLPPFPAIAHRILALEEKCANSYANDNENTQGGG